MAKITLRSYIRDIENLIDRNRIEEAIAHCKYLLKLFPKYIDAYRMLGKAYLEGQSYEEASDVLGRVLAVLPDDFIAHIGMSLVREDEGNLDGAIWHMERAFDVQPSNQAISDELRRLFGRRDGIEPPKIRLTKGALVRMYLRGELFPQAIAEAQSALLEDPKRVDIQVALLRAYHQAQLKVEAIELAHQVISVMPNNYDANFILSDLLNPAEKQDEAHSYRQFVISLNPYAAYLNAQIKSPDNVPDSAVAVDQLEWSPGTVPTTEPEWMQFSEEDKQVFKEISSPWSTDANSLMADTQNQSNFVNRAATNELPGTKAPEIYADLRSEESPDQNIPEWVTAAGWNKSGENLSPEDNNPEMDQLNNLEAAEIPSWLLSMAPKLEEQTDNINDISEKDNNLEELLTSSAVFPASSKNQFQTDLNTSPGIQPSENPEGSGWSPNTEPAQSLPAIAPNESNIPESLEELSKPDEPNTHEEISTADLPDWLKEMEQDLTEESAASTIMKGDELKDIPTEVDSSIAWLKSLADNTEETDQEASLPANQPEQPADWLGNESDTQIGSTQIQPPVHINDEKPTAAEEDAAFAWLESLAARHGADESSILNPDEDRLMAPVDWEQIIPSESEEILTPALVETEIIPEGSNQLEGDMTIPEVPRTFLGEDIVENDKLAILSQEIEDQTPANAPIEESIPEWMDTSDQVEHFDEKDETEVASWLDSLSKNDETFIPDSIASPSNINETIQTSPGLQNGTQETSKEQSSYSENQMLSDKPENKELLASQNDSVDFIAASEFIEVKDDSGEITEQSENDFDKVLNAIRKQMNSGEITSAIQAYTALIAEMEHLDEIIQDLRDALYQYPIDISIWQTLGDACARNNQIQDALDAYTKAEELLR